MEPQKRPPQSPNYFYVRNLHSFCFIYTSNFRTRFAVKFSATKKWLNKAIYEGKKVVDLIGGYSNLAVLNQLVTVIDEVMTA